MENKEQTFKLELTGIQINTIMEALGELPAKKSFELIFKLKMDIQQQITNTANIKPQLKKDEENKNVSK